MPKVILYVGPPGSGKTTHYKANHWGHARCSQDEQGSTGHFDLFNYCLANGYNVIVDRMNFNRKQREKYIEPAKKLGYEVEIIVFHTPKQVCLDRAINRKDHPTIKDEETARKAINFFFANYERPTEEEGRINFLNATGHKQSCIVVDLDGTLCNIDHRLHYVRGPGKKNWPAFLAGCKDDKPNEWCAGIIRRYQLTGDRIVFCSGRGEEYRHDTEKWLADNYIMYDALFMRPAGDSRPDDLIKEIILDFDILPQYEPLFFVDDRKRVVDMWRRRGFTCLQCAEGNF